MFSKRNKKSGRVLSKKGFTLIEMLIVIVIIGILAAALIPRLTSARGRANDTARKASIQQLATAMISYQIDNGSFPVLAGGGGASLIKDQLLKGGLSSLPKDPQADQSFDGIGTGTVGAGDFGYIRIKKNGSDNNGVALMAKVETEKAANWISTGSSSNGIIGNITESTTFESIYLCNSMTKSGSTTADNKNLSGTCYYGNGADLRYIFIY